MNEGGALKVGSVFEIAFASAAGACLPFLYLHWSNSSNGESKHTELDTQPIFFILKALSCGIIIGVALLHLLPDADELLSEQWDYPVCFAAAALGAVLCLICEQFAMWIVSTTNSEHASNEYDTTEMFRDVKTPLLENESLIGQLAREVEKEETAKRNLKSHQRIEPTPAHENHDHSHHAAPEASSISIRNRRISSSASVGRMVSVSGRPIRFESNCELGMAVRLFANAADTKTLLKAYVLEGAIAVHSIIMGISLGALRNDELVAIKVLMIAYGIHQSLEGISLGCAISATDLSFGKVVGLITFFSLTLPFGILIGLSIASATESQTGDIIAGFANGIAAGILIYVSMVEMMADEFSNKVVVDDYGLKAKMILAITGGIGIMAILAVWA